MIQKSYENDKASCYIVPTPIGNMKDMTERGKEVLEMVDAIFAEDTRVTQVLLNLLGIKKKLYQSQKFNEAQASLTALKYLKEGKNIAIVTDRGTPLISDPGSLVVDNIIKSGFNVIALPGACAFVPALNMSNINQEKFLFYGFLSSKESQAVKELEELKNINFTIVLYEAPHRLYKTLQNILEIVGNINISISREITKMHEEVFRGTVSEAIDYYRNVKGEIVIVLDNNLVKVDYFKYLTEVKELISLGVKPNDSIKYISKKYLVSRNILYDMLEEEK